MEALNEAYLARIEEHKFLKDAAYISSVLQYALEAESRVSAEEFYGRVRNVLQNMDHEDLILLHVLTLLNPKLPKFIRDKFRDTVGRNDQILSRIDEILREADGFIINVKQEAVASLSQDEHKWSGEESKDCHFIGTTNGSLEQEVKLEMEINGNGAAATSFKEEKLDPADFWEEPQDDLLDEDFLLNNDDHDDDVDDEDFKHWNAENVKKQKTKSKTKTTKKKRRKFKLDTDGVPPELKEDKETEEKTPKREKVVCYQCSFEAKRVRIMENHVKEEHEGVSKCQECDYTATSWLSVKKHIDQVHRLIRYPCTQCDYVGVNKPALTNHIRCKHEEKSYPCDECSYVGADLKYLRNHKAAQHTGRSYACDQCDVVVATNKGLQRHVKRKHEGQAFLCDQCDYKGSTKSYLQEHMESKHMGIRHYCDLCTYSSSVKRNLKAHKNVAHEGFVLPTFMCDQCQFTTKQKGLLNLHIKRKHDDIMCEHCSVIFQGTVRLSQHVKTCHYEVWKEAQRDKPPKKKSKAYTKNEGMLFLCDRCEYKTNNKYTLRHHMSTIHHIGTEPCTICNFVAKNSSHLQLHLAKHGSFPCNQCEHVANLKSGLARHKKAVHEERKYLCDHCDYFSARADILRIHRTAMHEGTKYPCDQCDYVAKRPGDLSKHKKNIHVAESIQCVLCTFASKTPKVMEKHYSEGHGLNVPESQQFVKA